MSIRGALGYFGVLANLLLGLFLAGLGTLGWWVGGDMHVPLIPVEAEQAARALLVAGAVAVVASLLAFRSARAARLPLLLWSLVVFGVVVAAFFRADYRIDGMDGLKDYGLLVLCSALLVFFCHLHRKMASRKTVAYRWRTWKSSA